MAMDDCLCPYCGEKVCGGEAKDKNSLFDKHKESCQDFQKYFAERLAEPKAKEIKRRKFLNRKDKYD